MSKRNDYLSSLEKSKQKALGNIQGKTTVVDETISAFEKSISEPTAEEKPVVLNKSFSINLKPKEAKRIHKNFLITKSINDKLVSLAKQTGVSENEIINEILKKAFAD